MESDLNLLRSCYDFCCKLQKKILQNENIEINSKFKFELETNLKLLVTDVLKHIREIIDFQWNYWAFSCRAIMHIHKKLLQDKNNIILDAQLKNSFQIYFELLHQIEVDCLHFSDGEIRNEGEKQESKRYCSFMDRNRNMEGIKNWQGIIELIEKPIDKQFTCISIDGMKVLCIHLFHFANIRGIKFTNFSMKHVELLIDASNIYILAAKEKVSYQNSS